MNDSVAKTLKAVTLGCRVNQYETEYLRQGFEWLGYREAADGEPIDVCIVNTCSVTAESEAKSRKTIRRWAVAHPESQIIVVGCYAGRAADEVAALPGVVDVVGDKRRLPDLLRRWGLAEPPSGIARFPGRRRAYVKVQDGCSMRCSYCIVPLLRGESWSRPADEVLAEVRCLVDRGHREIVLTGIHLGVYSRERGLGTSVPSCDPHLRLADLVAQITDLRDDFRVRLSSIEASEVTSELIELMARRPERICPHLHLPLQSGSDDVLARMNRRWPAERFIQRCQEIRDALDRPALSTDVIVGFPGETDADFVATCQVVEEVGFSNVHAFRFSPREGTPAAAMPGQVLNRKAQQRARDLARLGRLLRRRYAESLLGRRLQVLVERPVAGRTGWMAGASQYHVPVAVPGSRELIGQFASVTADRIEDGLLFGGR
ncbi:MAG: tRNA (N(6)-L-threonylcarbamoyladenosine(37)-C(2))-methylthiotransferase MtaB [Thermoguttaceae bacterium]